LQTNTVALQAAPPEARCGEGEAKKRETKGNAL
jgi:hypothetical protein